MVSKRISSVSTSTRVLINDQQLQKPHAIVDEYTFVLRIFSLRHGPILEVNLYWNLFFRPHMRLIRSHFAKFYYFLHFTFNKKISYNSLFSNEIWFGFNQKIFIYYLPGSEKWHFIILDKKKVEFSFQWTEPEFDFMWFSPMEGNF